METTAAFNTQNYCLICVSRFASQFVNGLSRTLIHSRYASCVWRSRNVKQFCLTTPIWHCSSQSQSVDNDSSATSRKNGRRKRTGRHLELRIRLTISSSFSMPVGMAGTARLMAAYSDKSGSSSAVKTGINLFESKALARNETLLIFSFSNTVSWWFGVPPGRHCPPGQ